MSMNTPLRKKRLTRVLVHSLLILGGLTVLGVPRAATQGANSAYVITLDDDTINPVTAEYITQSIGKAEQEGAELLVIQLDTPGGLLTSTRMIVKRMLTAQVPIAVYIGPSGSRAGSAGVFITYASHVAAMAPSTNIGAAHPVQMGGGDGPKQRSTDWGELKDLLEEIRDSQREAEREQKPESSSAESGSGADSGESANKTAEADSAEDDAPQDAADDSEPAAVQDNGGDSGGADDEGEELAADADPMSSKLLNDTVAFIKAIAQERGRNVEWAIDSVAKSDSITNDEALEKEVVEFVATDVSDLLRQIDGHTVRVNGRDVVLKTKNIGVVEIPMDARQSFLNILANPNIAYFLMILGFYGLLFEITNPGIGVPGILGAIFLILAFYGLQTLPTNYAGVALIILGLVLFVSEAYTPTFGLLTLGGAVCLVLGSVLLFDTVDPVMRVDKKLIGGLALATAGTTLVLLTYLLKGQRNTPMGGYDRLIGQKGEAKRDIKPGEEGGRVFVSGELWSAVSDQEIAAGEKIIVDAVLEGMTVKVRKLV